MSGTPEPDRHPATAALLNEVFGLDPPLGAEDLTWYYDRNPTGVASVGRVEDAGRRLGNYALVPTRFRRGDEELTLGLGVDLAVLPEARGAGTFRRTVEDAYARGAADGLDGILGVANAQSAPRMVKTLGWASLPPLPVRLLGPGPRPAPLAHHRVDGAFLASARFDELVPEAFPPPADGWAPVWTRSLLRWRLAKPRARYVLHAGDDVVAVSTRTSIKGLPVAVLLKVLARRRLDEPLSGSRIAAAVARRHRTPLVVHWGVNAALRVHGLPLPRERMPSPLELVTYSFHAGFDAAGLRFDAFEFLDFDAY
jgi:GNAT superfamily N-acetyltransferase